MNKIKVSEIANELNITDSEVMKKLKDIGVEVKTKASTISEQDAAKIKNKKKEAVQPHIIRRNIKVINTDSGKSEIEQITTNISGGIKKSHQTLNENKTVEKPYSKEGLGVITPRSYPNRNNIIVTRNGKVEDKVEDKVEVKVEDKVEVKVEVKVENE
ncbi:MAG: translation initiation factor IF-2 N-terminal domain-containing protein, partial [Clostridia bacterium]